MARSLPPLSALLFALAPAIASAAWETKNVAGVDTRIYTPATTSPLGGGHGLMIGLHGCSQTADDLMNHANLEHTAEDFGIVIVLPNVPGGGVYAGCWSYYGPVHTRTSGHEGPVIEMVETLLSDGALAIDPAQVWLAGFSAGGGEAVVLGCLAPDLFAGVGVGAGPSVGTTGNDIGQVGTTVAEATALCEQLAGTYAPHFDTQLAVTLTDTNDFVVAQGYAEINAQMYGSLFAGGVDAMTEAAIDVASLPGALPMGQGSTWSDAEGPRIALLTTSGVGHNWPAGSGAAAGALTFVAGNGLDFAYYLAEFFTENARRTEGGAGDDGADDTSGAGTGDGGDGDAGDGSSPGTGAGSGDDDDGSGGGENGDGSGDGGGAPPGADDDGFIEPTGCQCTASPRERDHTALGLLAMLALAGVRRRAR
jgi:poly(3-hydroxybutyrate) depolymerase